MQKQTPKYRIAVHPPKLQPKMTSIGYGNPRYNSMLVYKEGVLLTSGSHLRYTNVRQNKIVFDRQVGFCQIFQLQENLKYILVVNYDGCISLLDKNSLEVRYQFYAPGKEIRHSSFTDKYLACSCELMDGTDDGLLVAYKIEDIEKGSCQPFSTLKGNFYFPEFYNDELTVLEYFDSNPKGRKRKDTVMNQKLPITNQLLKLDSKMNVIFTYVVKNEGEMICCSRNKGVNYYLHSNKFVTVMDIQTGMVVELPVQSKSFPHLVENYQNGVVFASQPNKLSHIAYDFNQKQTKVSVIEIKTMAIGGNLSLKFSEQGIYSLNQSGLHFYEYHNKNTISQSLFSITNCGISFNKNGNLFAVADFGGSFFVFNSAGGDHPDPLFSVFVGIPIRSIVWCPHTNNLVIGCVGGTLFWWIFGEPEANMVKQYEHTINIIRAVEEKIFTGCSDGTVNIFDAYTMELLGEYKAHHPIQYQTEEERELFGSMKNYAQIWSLTIPKGKQELFIVSSCEDQTEKVFLANLKEKRYDLLHHLKGHQLAVTSVDWQLMNEHLGQVYVSCSDDKIVRFRDPQKHFEVMFEVETSTIKEWHTLTYLALQPRGHRVAIGSQNGYLFIYDIWRRELLFGEKVHLGGIEGLDWNGNKICTCSSDLCINVLEV